MSTLFTLNSNNFILLWFIWKHFFLWIYYLNSVFKLKFEEILKTRTIDSLLIIDKNSLVFGLKKMGSADSTFYSTVIDSWRNPELMPKVTDKPRHDPNYGFQEQRTERGFLFIFDDFFLIISFK